MVDELFHADGQTDMTKLIVSFRNFSNAPKKLYILPEVCVDAFCMDLKINSDNFPRPKELSDFITKGRVFTARYDLNLEI